MRPAGSNRGAQPTSYAGATNRATEWASPGGRGGASLKAQSHGGGNPASPNPYAPAFVSSSPSPWVTPAGGSSAAARFKPRSNSGATGAQRTLFPDGGKNSSSGGWDEADSGLDATGGGGNQEESTLLRNNHPDHWESYDATTNSSVVPSSATTEPASLNLTPFESPTMGPYRTTEINGEKLILDERGTDISLSLIKKEGEGPGEVSIHMLSLLYDPPVQGCELKPYVSVLSEYKTAHTDSPHRHRSCATHAHFYVCFTSPSLLPPSAVILMVA